MSANVENKVVAQVSCFSIGNTFRTISFSKLYIFNESHFRPGIESVLDRYRVNQPLPFY